jgi:hypothetical protein
MGGRGGQASLCEVLVMLVLLLVLLLQLLVGHPLLRQLVDAMQAELLLHQQVKAQPLCTVEGAATW